MKGTQMIHAKIAAEAITNDTLAAVQAAVITEIGREVTVARDEQNRIELVDGDGLLVLNFAAHIAARAAELTQARAALTVYEALKLTEVDVELQARLFAALDPLFDSQMLTAQAVEAVVDTIAARRASS